MYFKDLESYIEDFKRNIKEEYNIEDVKLSINIRDTMGDKVKLYVKSDKGDTLDLIYNVEKRELAFYESRINKNDNDYFELNLLYLEYTPIKFNVRFERKEVNGGVVYQVKDKFGKVIESSSLTKLSTMLYEEYSKNNYSLSNFKTIETYELDKEDFNLDEYFNVEKLGYNKVMEHNYDNCGSILLSIGIK